MKRARDSSLSETQMIGPSITDLPLPPALFAEILLKLPVSSIVMCKSVCKDWYGSISDPQFVKLHSARARPCALIRGKESWTFSRSLYLLEPEDDRGLYSGYCSCRERKKRCKNCVTDEEVKFKLKIPVRNVQLMLDRVADRDDSNVFFSIGTSMMHKCSVRMQSRKDHCYNVVNSSNGCLCVASNDSPFRSVCICNPVTGEFMCLPDGRDRGNYPVQFDVFGFGFSPKHDRYKVIRMSTRPKHYPDTGGFQGRCAIVIEIHTLGLDSWRSLDILGSETPAIDSPSYLNGALYWTCRKDKKHYVASFAFDQELFNYFPILPSPDTICNLGLKILEGRLILYTNNTYSGIDIWPLNECGDSFSCTKMFAIDFAEYHDHRMWFRYQPVSCLNNEAVVLFCDPLQEFIHYDRLRGLRFIRPEFHSHKPRSTIEVVDFTPSFVSLKDVVMPGSNVEVLNVNSRCGKLKLLEETYPLFLSNVFKSIGFG